MRRDAARCRTARRRASRDGVARAQPRDAPDGQRGDGAARARGGRALDYRPNPIARGLKTNRSYTIGVLVPDLTNPLFPPIVRGIQDKLEQAGYTPLIANTDNDPERERNDFEAMRARQVDGVITATARLDHGVLDEMAAPACRSCSSTAGSTTARCRRRPPTTTRARGSRSRTWPRSATPGSPTSAARRTSRPAGCARGLPGRHGRGRPRARTRAVRQRRSRSPRARGWPGSSWTRARRRSSPATT